MAAELLSPAMYAVSSPSVPVVPRGFPSQENPCKQQDLMLIVLVRCVRPDGTKLKYQVSILARGKISYLKPCRIAVRVWGTTSRDRAAFQPRFSLSSDVSNCICGLGRYIEYLPTER